MHAQSCVKFQAEKLQVPAIAAIVEVVYDVSQPDAQNWKYDHEQPNYKIQICVATAKAASTSKNRAYRHHHPMDCNNHRHTDKIISVSAHRYDSTVAIQLASAMHKNCQNK